MAPSNEKKQMCTPLKMWCSFSVVLPALQKKTILTSDENEHKSYQICMSKWACDRNFVVRKCFVFFFYSIYIQCNALNK